jgi:hypothetical protein
MTVAGPGPRAPVLAVEVISPTSRLRDAHLEKPRSRSRSGSSRPAWSADCILRPAGLRRTPPPAAALGPTGPGTAQAPS